MPWRAAVHGVTKSQTWLKDWTDWEVPSHLLYLTLCDPMDFSPPGSSVHGDSPGKEYWSGLPCPPPGDLPNPGLKPVTLMSPALIGGFFFFSFFLFLPLALSRKPGSLSVILYLCDQYQYISALNSFVCTCFLPTLAIWDDWLGLIKGRLPSDSLQDYWLLPWPQYPRKKWMR